MNPIRLVWTDPRAATKTIASSGLGISFIPLAGIYGAAVNLSKAMSRGVDPSTGLSSNAVIALNLGLGFVYGVVILYSASFPLSWVGRRLGGIAGPEAVRSVLGLASLPFAVLLIIVVPLLLFGPSELLVRSGASVFETFGTSNWLFAVVFYHLLWAGLSIWLIVIGVIGLSEVHAFTVARSFATFVIVGIGFVTAYMLIVAALVTFRLGA